MKAIGLAVLLAQVGSFVPATAMKLRPFRKLATRILNQDNLWAGLSSFAVEMSELREILSVADHQTLVLGDELCAGTESVSATAIVAAGISWLTKSSARFVLATHLHDLMKLEIVNLPSLRVWHLHVETCPKTGKLIYHRQLRPGPGSTLYGLEVARALHLPHDMLEMARVYRQTLSQDKPLEERHVSSWNVDIVRRACEVCGNHVERDLEVHHVQPRELAKHGRNSNGTALHSLRNLAVLCDACHDKHHAGELTIGSVADTSEGPERFISPISAVSPVSAVSHPEGPPSSPSQSVESSYISLDTYRYPTATAKATKGREPTFSEEELVKIRETRNAYPFLRGNLMIRQIQKDHGIELTERTLKRLFERYL